MKNLILTIAVFISSFNVFAQGVAPSSVKKSLLTTIQQIGVNIKDVKTPGLHAYKVSGHEVVVRVNESSNIEHVGIPLFSQSMRKQMPSPVYDFLEYTLLKKTLSLPGDDVRINSVTFKKGNWETLLTVNDNMLCSVSSNMGRLYEVSWQAAGKLIASLTFPVQYDLLMLSSKDELENLLIRELIITNGTSYDYSIKTSSTDTFSSEYINKGIYMLEGETYLKNSISDNLYYREKGHTFRLFSSSQYPAESLANILLRADKSLPKAYVTLRVVKYDGSVKQLEMAMADWLWCMDKSDCQCYYGFDKVIEGKATAVLYASNSKAGYDHVLMLECNINQLDQPVVHLTGTAYLFSPTSNVRNLFYQYKK